MESQAVFARELRYVMPPGVNVSAIENPSETPFAIADDHPTTRVLVSVNGRVDYRDKNRDERSRRIIDFIVVDDNRAPMAGAHVRMLGDRPEGVQRTDESGRCRGVIEGPKTSEAHFHVRSADGSLERVVTVYFSGQRTEKKVVLGKGALASNTVSFSGRVVDRQGRPVAGASLWAYGFHASHGVGLAFLSREIGTTNAEGKFRAEIPRMPVGSSGWGGGWMDPWICQVIAHKLGQGFGWAEAEGDSAITGLRISLAPADGLRGTVRDKDDALLPNVLVQVEEIEVAGKSLLFEGVATLPPWLETRTNDGGRFVLDDLPADATVKLGVSTCGAGEGYRADQMGPDLGEIKLAEQSGELDIQLVQQPVISGVLLTPEGEPAAGVEVELNGAIKGEPHSTFGHNAFTDEEGHYRFALSVAGTWTISVADTRFSGVLARELKVDLGEQVTLPTTVLQKSVIIRGRVLDAATGAPVPNVHVRCRSTELSAPAGPLTTETGATTGPNGSFEVGGPPGRDVLSYSGPPKGYTWNHAVKKETRDGRRQVEVTEDPAKPSHRVLTVEPGEALSGLDLFVTREAEVTGVVLGPDGRPWQPKSFERGGYVHADLDREVVTSTSYPPLGSRVERDGTFSARYFYAGVPVVLMVVDEEGGLGGAARFTPELGMPTQVTIRLSPTATVAGRVVMPDGTPAVGAAVGMGCVIAAIADEQGRFAMRRGIADLPLSVTVYLPGSPRESEGGPWPEYRAESERFEIGPGEKTYDVGDIVLEPYEYPETD
jgi:5-hydroxyisourate hydrolase-like protein (transthyretin family)